MDKKEEKEVENKKITLKEIITNKRYRAIAALVFYPLIIIILIVYARTLPSTKSGNTNSNFKEFSNVTSKNFEFSYSLTTKDGEVSFDGKQFLNKILFTDSSTDKEYFIKDDMILENVDNKYVLSTFPVRYFNYLDVDLIDKIISKAKKDENDYVIKWNDFSEIIGNATEVDKADSEILIETETANDKITIKMNLGDYIEDSNENDNKITLELEYFNFGKVEDFNIN